ncbi:MAG: type I methionyl aminopeptidase [Deltaproteobacteria bacterium]|nr:MAG: type I methionyl aminopeptidase [Deltaproteobacteria bacterium]
MINIRTPQEIAKIRKSSSLVARALQKVREAIRPGVTTAELDRIAEETIRRGGGVPAFKGYRGFPASLCVSVNEEVVHGIPGRRRLKEGDIVSLDLGVLMDGYYGDAAITVPVGEVSELAKRLLQVTEEALYRGIEKARAGNRLFDISHAIQRWVEAAGFSVVRDFVGHGIGRALHEEPQVPNFGPPNQGPRLDVGMVLAIEPMVNTGTWRVRVLENGWTVVTADGGLSAHFEHTVAITEGGPEILSLP